MLKNHGALFLETLLTNKEHFGADRYRRSGFHVSDFIAYNYRRSKCNAVVWKRGFSFASLISTPAPVRFIVHLYTSLLLRLHGLIMQAHFHRARVSSTDANAEI